VNKATWPRVGGRGIGKQPTAHCEKMKKRLGIAEPQRKKKKKGGWWTTLGKEKPSRGEAGENDGEKWGSQERRGKNGKNWDDTPKTRELKKK